MSIAERWKQVVKEKRLVGGVGVATVKERGEEKRGWGEGDEEQKKGLQTNHRKDIDLVGIHVDTGRYRIDVGG